MEPLDVIALLSYFLLLIGIAIHKIAPRCDHPDCIAAHIRHRDRESREEQERQRRLREEADHFWHVSPNPNCPQCRGRR